MNTRQRARLYKLHWLLPEGLLAEAARFGRHGNPSNLRACYVAAG